MLIRKQPIARQKIVSFTKTTIRYEIVFAKFEERWKTRIVIVGEFFFYGMFYNMLDHSLFSLNRSTNIIYGEIIFIYSDNTNILVLESLDWR